MKKRSDDGGLKVLTVRVPETMIEELRQLVEEGRYTSQAEAARDALREGLAKLKEKYGGVRRR